MSTYAPPTDLRGYHRAVYDELQLYCSALVMLDVIRHPCFDFAPLRSARTGGPFGPEPVLSEPKGVRRSAPEVEGRHSIVICSRTAAGLNNINTVRDAELKKAVRQRDIAGDIGKPQPGDIAQRVADRGLDNIKGRGVNRQRQLPDRLGVVLGVEAQYIGLVGRLPQANGKVFLQASHPVRKEIGVCERKAW